MLIDLSVLKETGNKKEIKSQLKFEDLTFQKRKIVIPDKLALQLTIYKARDSFIFTGNLTGKIIIECSRCLEPFSMEIELEIEKDLSIQEIEDLENFNIMEMIKPDLFLVIPIKPLCSEECQGICPLCGKNLNEEECDCTVDDVDPRLEKLKDFYENDS